MGEPPENNSLFFKSIFLSYGSNDAWKKTHICWSAGVPLMNSGILLRALSALFVQAMTARILPCFMFQKTTSYIWNLSFQIQ